MRTSFNIPDGLLDEFDDTWQSEGLDDCLVDADAIDEDWEVFDNPFPGTMDWSKPPMQQRLVVGDAK